MIGAFKSGQVDAMLMVPHIAKPLERGGAGKIIGWLRDYLPDYQITVLLSSTKNIKEKPELVRKFLRAYSKGMADFNRVMLNQSKDPAATEAMVKLIHKYVYTSRPYAKAAPSIKAGAMYLNPGASLDPREHQAPARMAPVAGVRGEDGHAGADRRYQLRQGRTDSVVRKGQHRAGPLGGRPFIHDSRNARYVQGVERAVAMAEFPGMKTVRMRDRPAQVYRGDLCVVGSGAAGLSAALEAVRLGRTVVLVDAAPQLGGQAVGGRARHDLRPVPQRAGAQAPDPRRDGRPVRGPVRARRRRPAAGAGNLHSRLCAERLDALGGTPDRGMRHRPPCPGPSSAGSNTGTAM